MRENPGPEKLVREGLRGEESIAELCRREGISPNLYYNWSKEFLEAGKARLTGNTTATHPRSKRTRAGRRAASYHAGLEARATNGRPHGLPASPVTPDSRSEPGPFPCPKT